MKKVTKRIINSFLSLALAAALVASFTPAKVSAVTVQKTTPEAGNADYLAADSYSLSVHGNITGAEVISANLTWGNLVYNYALSGWDASTLTEIDAGTGWVPAVAGTSDLITVENRSNVNLHVNFVYQSADTPNYTQVQGAFDAADFNLPTKYRNATLVDTQRFKNVKLTLTGAPDNTDTLDVTNQTIGYVIITLGKAE